MTTLTKSRKLCAYLIILLAMLISHTVMASDTNTPINTNLNPTPTSETNITTDTSNSITSLINQLQSIFEAIKFKIQHIFDVSLGPKLMAIINTIASQCKSLVELITGPPNPSDSAKVDSIANNIETQRKSLWSLILPSSEQEPNTSPDTYINNMNGTNTKNQTFEVYAR